MKVYEKEMDEEIQILEDSIEEFKQVRMKVAMDLCWLVNERERERERTLLKVVKLIVCRVNGKCLGK